MKSRLGCVQRSFSEGLEKSKERHRFRLAKSITTKLILS